MWLEDLTVPIQLRFEESIEWFEEGSHKSWGPEKITKLFQVIENVSCFPHKIRQLEKFCQQILREALRWKKN